MRTYQWLLLGFLTTTVAAAAPAQDFVISYASPTLQRKDFGFFRRDEAQALARRLQDRGLTEVTLDTTAWAVSYRLTEVQQRRFFSAAAAEFFRRNVVADGLLASAVVRDGFETILLDPSSGLLTISRGVLPAPVYYVRYISPEWHTTDAMEAEFATALQQRLKLHGAETKVLQSGARFDDPAFPTKVQRFLRVRYRVVERQEIRCEGAFQAQVLRDELRGLTGFTVSLSDRPTDSGTRDSSTERRKPRIVQLPARSSWRGEIRQEGVSLPALLTLRLSDDRLEGELTFSHRGKRYRARVRGEINETEVLLTSYEALEGRLYIPTKYEGELKGRQLQGVWEYARAGLAGDFHFLLED